MISCVPPHKTIKYFLRRSALHLIIGLFIYCINITNVKAQNVVINFNGATPNASAAFDIDVTALGGQKKGLLIARVTLNDRTNMNPFAGSCTRINRLSNRW